jgi:hypothetical protein
MTQLQSQRRPAMRALLGLAAGLLLAAAAGAKTLWGFTPFPYDFTPEAVTRTNEIVRDNSSIYALHLDDGLPWEAVMEGKPFPKKVQKDWDDWARNIPAGRPVYLAITPLAKDRKSLAPSHGDKGSEDAPWSVKFADLDDKKIKKAFTEYARRAVAQFKPTYLNIGIEAGEMASREPKKWRKFEELYRHVYAELKRDNPNLKIGISFGLQSLMKPDVAERVKSLVDASDYIGISFYPSNGEFGEKFGDPALAPREEGWRQPFDWLKRYAGNKPIAICETGYGTQDAEIKSFKIKMRGDNNLQAAYVREMAQYAARDNWLFVIWFLPVDYDKLYERMGGSKSAGNEANLLWRNIGFFDGNVNPKPGWEEWKRAVGGKVGGEPPKPTAAAEPPKPGKPQREKAAPSVGAAPTEIGFSSERQLFQAGPGTRASLDGDAMLWKIDYKGDDWAWAYRELGTSVPATARRMHLRYKSDRDGAVFVQIEENDGEAWFLMLEPSKDWKDVDVNLSNLQVDPNKRKDGVLQPDRLSKLTIADAAARDRKARGERRIWLSRWIID